MKAENMVIGICGHKGSGKTTLLTFFLFAEYEIKIKENIFCNYRLNFKFEWLDAFKLMVEKEKYENSCIGIDELHEYADSRNSSSTQNKLISDFFLQSRHTNANVYYTTQFFDQIDKRIRRITDIDILIENCKIDSDNDGNDDIFKFIIYDTSNRKFTEKTFYATPIFKMFNSKERINPFMVGKQKMKDLIKKFEDLNEEKFTE